MAKDKNISPSVLSQTHLSFEYNESWKDTKRALRIRTNTRG